jgi:hypothetical protein
MTTETKAVRRIVATFGNLTERQIEREPDTLVVDADPLYEL